MKKNASPDRRRAALQIGGEISGQKTSDIKSKAKK